MYTDMERTGYIYSKIKDVYRARKMARTCGGKVDINGEIIGESYAIWALILCLCCSAFSGVFVSNLLLSGLSLLLR